MPNTYYYHVVPADTSSTRVTLTKQELYALEKTLSREVSDNYRVGNHDARAQRKAAQLISISYHCLGGNDPCHLSNKSSQKKKSKLLPRQYRFDYLSFFMEELIKSLKNFDRSKGCWTQYVLWAKGKGLRSTYKLMDRGKDDLDMLEQVRAIVAQYESRVLIDC